MKIYVIYHIEDAYPGIGMEDGYKVVFHGAVLTEAKAQAETKDHASKGYEEVDLRCSTAELRASWRRACKSSL